jgi:dTDP-4-amino-4,6-dideoxygalactose transaminase
VTIAASASRARAADESLALLPEERWPFYAQDEIDAVVDLLRSGRVNQWTGDAVFRFQEACTARFEGGNGIALANGSLALELPLRAFGVGPGDEVIVTPRTFVASASCARLVGATPVFAEVDPDSGNITAESIAAAITARTKAVIPVHLAGWPADMPAIMAVAERHGLKVIEDCAQAHGAEVDGRSVGGFGEAAAFSFCQDKIVSTAGEGGFASFRDREAWEWAWAFKDHGKSWAKVNAPPLEPGFRWLHDSVGTNWRMPGPQAAVGLVQLGKLETWRALRERNAMIWREALHGINGVRVPMPAARFRHAWYKFYFYVVPEAGREARDEILQRGSEAGLQLFSGSCSEVYRERAFADLARPDLPIAHSLGELSLMTEVHPTLDPERLERRAETLAKVVRQVLG